MSDTRILVIGACGQVGTELVENLALRFGNDAVIASDIRDEASFDLAYIKLDVMDREAVKNAIVKHKITEVYNLAALLSATAEKNPEFGWKLNMEGLFSILDLAKEGVIKKVFWPSSIAVFGPTTPRIDTPQFTIIEPTTVYGISKFAGERWCEYYHKRWGVDVRSVRYPGLIGYKSLPGGGTTDYAVDIFHQALKEGSYECFLKENTALPMMYMSDAIKATIDIMQVPAEEIKIRSSYNISAMSFDPAQIANEIKKHIPEFSISYNPDFRQAIADNWPASINDNEARKDWNWSNAFTLENMVTDMLENLKERNLVG
ncbi:MAG: NAD-dependent epimerase/dehydratase family protein [Salibacteraceae bacterium]|jgi:nucleoside-diphosphate-sugar epimerase|nr:NAD-dependent epimerase/dehydratase family protein [Salibacteraceae bacterium]MDP4687960.1 NAD-dependent epimerase/dehydratase family protein [Salibacteraceae bacterium]MDP4764033.1 NAD-dependent epimerase/dehydratase family protein [Salibacteraceae bacterium]